MMRAIWRPIQRGIGFDQAYPPHRSIIGFGKKFLNDWSLGFGSLLAYSFVIALLPLIIAALGILGLVLKESPGAKDSIIDAVAKTLPDNKTQNAVRDVADLAANNLEGDAGAIFAIGIIFALWGGSRLFVAIEQVFTIIHRTTQRSFIKQNLIAIAMLLLFIFLMIIMFIVGGAPSFAINALPNKNGAQFGIFIAGIVISVFVAFIFFMFLYKIVPNRKMATKDIWCGALIAGILLDLFVILFPLYIRRFMGSFLGLLGFAIILITFFYYFSLILIIGAQINAYFFQRIQPLPEGLGTFLTQSVERLMKRTAPPPPVAHYNPYYRPRRPPQPYF